MDKYINHKFIFFHAQAVFLHVFVNLNVFIGN